MRGATGVVIGFLVVVIIAALSVLVLGFTVLGWGSPERDKSTTRTDEEAVVVETTVVTVTAAPSESTPVSSPNTGTSPKESPRARVSVEETDEVSPTPSKAETSRKPTTTERRSGFGVPDGAMRCGDSGRSGVYAGTDVTSCGFAMNVGKQIADQGGNSTRAISAVSPVTGKKYRMTCSPKGAGAWECRGGDNAVVYVVP
ncbi:hypothetical protein [Corynebacterium sp. CCM 9203]|uniref:hypothetical protein n=1 Tax=Corynebacterium sp. CCM 9203 TaxID=3057615 RepID=UPI0035264EF4